MKKHRERQRERRTQACAALLGAALLLGPSTSLAADCEGWRPYQGKVTEIGPDRIAVSRGGGVAAFERAAGVRVLGRSGTTKWSGLRVGQRVKVCWAFDDEPRAARVVHILGSD